ncbi:hypothetical protein ACJMK2_037871 [Sinanodonta woodiana]|uniref:General transcription factor II-I repeat domain-containing protein 2 n=1 Tax=Sinanodonta woodiana TaxID=1069815 RepID=A0ABD3WLS7_SINWO
MKVVEHISPEKKEQFGTICLSKQTVTRRVEDIVSSLHQQLERASEKFIWHSVAFDESTDVSDTAQLLIFIRGMDENFKITEDIAGLYSMYDMTKGRDVVYDLKRV